LYLVLPASKTIFLCALRFAARSLRRKEKGFSFLYPAFTSQRVRKTALPVDFCYVTGVNGGSKGREAPNQPYQAMLSRARTTVALPKPFPSLLLLLRQPVLARLPPLLFL
jgi:hypothetical protein